MPTQSKHTTIKRLPIFSGERDLQKFLEQNMADNLKQLIKVTVQIMVRTEMEAFRSQFEEKLQFNGNYFRQMFSTFGKVENIPVPRFRSSVENMELKTLGVFGEEKERFTSLIGQMHLMGISQRKIKRLTKICLNTNISKDRVGAIYKELAEREEMIINKQLLDDDFKYLFLDGIWEKTKGYGWDDNRSVLLCALGVRANGERKLLGFALERSEDSEGWKRLLRDIKKRGLKGDNLSLIITDDHSSIKVAADSIYTNIPIQLCVVHKMRNVLGKTSQKSKASVANDLKLIFQSQTKEEGIAKAKSVIKKWYIENIWKNKVH
jgi:putative transposase